MLLHGYDLMEVEQIVINARRYGLSAPIAEAMWASHLVHKGIEASADRAMREIKEMADTARRSLGQRYRRIRESMEACHG